VKTKFLILLFFITPAFGQSLLVFQRTIGGGATGAENANSIEPTSDGGYIIGGYSDLSGFGLTEFYLVKMDSNASLLWTKSFGGIYNDECWSVHQTRDGGYIMAGYTNSFGNGGSDGYLVKTDPSGNLLWSKTIGGPVDETLDDLIITSDGGYLLGGHSTSYGGGISSLYVVKTDSAGNTLWTKTYGGTVNQWGASVAQTFDGGYVFLSTTNSFGAGDFDFYLVKTAANGNVIWSKTFGGTGDDYARSIQQTADSGYILTGNTRSFGVGNADVYLVKTDVNGNLLWSKTYGGTSDDGGFCVRQTSDNGFIIGGNTISFGLAQTDIYVIKTNLIGDTLWTRTYGGAEYDWGASVLEVPGGGYLIAGQGSSRYAVYLIKTDSRGYSGGCYQRSPPTMVTTPNTQVSNPATLVSSGVLTTTPATVVTSGGTVVTLCQAVVQDPCVTSTLTASASKNDISCNGYDDGTATALAHGGVPPYSYLWSNGQNTETATELQEGLYSIVVYDSNSCTAFASVLITEPTLLIATDSSVTSHVTCYGSSDGAAKIIASGGTPPYTFLWSDGHTGDSPTDLPAGGYSVTVIDFNGCTAYTTVSIQEGPVVFAGVIIGLSTAVINQSAVYSVNANFNYTYDWNVINGTITLGQGTNSIEVLWDSASTGTVQLIATELGCSDTVSKTITLLNNPTAINGVPLNHFEVYPNPSSESLIIRDSNQPSVLTIYDVMGREMYRTVAEQKEVSINVSAFPNGVYFLRAQTKETFQAAKFSIRK